MAEMPPMQRQMLVDLNPLLRGAEILFVKRYTYNSKHFYDDFQHISRWGGNLCVLSLADGRVRELVPQLAGGVFDRYDLSFDARRIVFGYRRPQARGLPHLRDRRGRPRAAAADAVLRPTRSAAIAAYGQTSTGDGFYGSHGLPVLDRRRPSLLPARRRDLLRLDALRARRAVHARRITWRARTCSAWTPTAADCGRISRGAERVHADDDGGRADPLQPLGIRVQGDRRRAAAVDHASGRLGRRGVLRRQHRQSRRVLAGPAGARPSAAGGVHRLRARAAGRRAGAAAGPEQGQAHARADDQPDART